MIERKVMRTTPELTQMILDHLLAQLLQPQIWTKVEAEL
jgi:hypothetical protein